MLLLSVLVEQVHPIQLLRAATEQTQYLIQIQLSGEAGRPTTMHLNQQLALVVRVAVALETLALRTHLEQLGQRVKVTLVEQVLLPNGLAAVVEEHPSLALTQLLVSEGRVAMDHLYTQLGGRQRALATTFQEHTGMQVVAVDV